MRRKDKEIYDQSLIEEVIKKSKVCRLAMSDNNIPYIVPMCFGYRDETLYFHCAREGKKIDILKKNPKVCFEFDIDTQLFESQKGCNWSMKYKSVIGHGTATFITDLEKKRIGLDAIMNQYSNKSFTFPEQAIKNTFLFKVTIETMTGKQSI